MCSLPGYVFHRKLEDGKKGTSVFLATQKSTQEKVAIKVIRLQGNNRADCQQEISFHLALAKVLPELCPLYSYHWQSKYLYLVLKFLDGGDLTQYILQDNLTMDHLMDLFQQCIWICMKLYRLGILHRDLKMENLMVHQKRIFLIDMGYSKWVPQIETCKETWQASIDLIPPEYQHQQVSGSANKAYSWTLGLLLFRLLSAQKIYPFDWEDTIDFPNDEETGKFFTSQQWAVLGHLWVKENNRRDFILSTKLYKTRQRWQSRQKLQQSAFHACLIYDLLNRLLTPNVKDRIDLFHILKHPLFHSISWYPLENNVMFTHHIRKIYEEKKHRFVFKHSGQTFFLNDFGAKITHRFFHCHCSSVKLVPPRFPYRCLRGSDLIPEIVSILCSFIGRVDWDQPPWYNQLSFELSYPDSLYYQWYMWIAMEIQERLQFGYQI